MRTNYFIFTILVSLLLSRTLSAGFDCLRHKFILASSKINKGFESVREIRTKISNKKPSNVIDNIQLPLNDVNTTMKMNQLGDESEVKYEISTQINQFEFLKFIYHSELNDVFNENEEIIIYSVCMAYIIEKSINNILAEVFCKRFMKENNEVVQFMKNYNSTGSKIFGDIFFQSIDENLTEELNKMQESEYIKMSELNTLPNQKDLALKLEDKYRKINDQLYRKFVNNVERLFDQRIKTNLLQTFSSDLNIKQTILEDLKSKNIIYNEEDLINKEIYLLLFLFSRKMNIQDISQNSLKIRKILKKLSVEINSNKISSMFFKRLADRIFIILDKNYVDLSLYFELFLLPFCYRSFVRLEMKNPVQECKKSFQNVYTMFFKNTNQNIAVAYYIFSLSPKFVHKFKYVFEKNYLKFSENKLVYSQVNMDNQIKKELLELVQKTFQMIDKINLNSIMIREKDLQVLDVVKKRAPNRIIWSLIPEIYLLCEKFPLIIQNYLGEKNSLALLENKLLNDRWYLNSSEGKSLIYSLKNNIISDKNIDHEIIWEQEFFFNLHLYSVESLRPELSDVLISAGDGVTNIQDLIPYHQKKTPYSLMVNKIKYVLHKYDKTNLSNAAIELAHAELEKMIKKIKEYENFYFSIDMPNTFSIEVQEEIINEMLQLMSVSDRQKAELNLKSLGLKDFLLNNKLKNQFVFTEGLMIAFSVFFKLSHTNQHLQLDDIVNEYIKWNLMNFVELNQLESIEDVRITKMNNQIKRYLKNKFKNESIEVKVETDEGNKRELSPLKMELFFNSLISIDQMSNSDIKDIILKVSDFDPFMTNIINECSPNQSVSKQVLQLCREENPSSDCFYENNFLIKTKCPLGANLINGTNSCLELCPQGFDQSKTNHFLCKKPEIQFRKIRTRDNLIVAKRLTDEESEFFKNTKTLGNNNLQNTEIQVQKIFNDVQVEFNAQNSRELSEEQRSNIFNNLYQMTDCPPNFKELSLFCIPSCPEGWEDVGSSCIKPMIYKIEKYLIIE